MGAGCNLRTNPSVPLGTSRPAASFPLQGEERPSGGLPPRGQEGFLAALAARRQRVAVLCRLRRVARQTRDDQYGGAGPNGEGQLAPVLLVERNPEHLRTLAWRRDNHLHAEPLRERVTVGHEARRLPAFEVALKVVAPVDSLDADVVNRQPRLVDSVVCQHLKADHDLLPDKI